MDPKLKRREARLRYAAAAVGLTLQRSRKRLRHIPEAGTYRLLSVDGPVGGGQDGWGLDLDGVERLLASALAGTNKGGDPR